MWKKMWRALAITGGAILGVLLFILGRRTGNANGGGVRDVERELDAVGDAQRRAGEELGRARDTATEIEGTVDDLGHTNDELDRIAERDRDSVTEGRRIIDESRDILARARRRAQAENILDGSD